MFAEIAKLTSTASSPNLSPSHLAPALSASFPIHPLQAHAVLTTLNIANTVAPDANGNCPPGYHQCSIGLGCCPNLG